MPFADQHIVEALRGIGLLALPEDIQLIQSFQVEMDGAVFGVDLE